MRLLLAVAVVLFVNLSFAGRGGAAPSFPMRFEENLGQWPEQVLFVGRGSDTGLLNFTREGLAFDTGLQISFKNANKNPTVYGTHATGGESAYYVGNPTFWAEGVRHYGHVVYKDIYPGIDVIYHPSGKTLEYDLIVAPGADPSQMKMVLKGQKSVRLNAEGNLVIQSTGGQITLKKPISYQTAENGRTEVRSAYRMLGKRQVGFKLGAYDESKELVVDPVAQLNSSSYLDGNSTEVPLGITTTTSSGSVDALVVVGYTKSSNFFTAFNGASSYQDSTLSGTADGFVTIGTADFTTVNYSVFLGGLGTDVINAVVTDSSRNIYVTGYSTSSDFPGGNAADGADAFVAKLARNSVNKYSLAYGTFIAGTTGSFEQGANLVLDTASATCTTAGSPCVDLVGTTTQTDSRGNAFFAKLSSTGTVSIALKEFGGTGQDLGQAIILDASNNPIIAGLTRSSGSTWKNSGVLMTTSPFTLAGTQNVFVARLSSTGTLPTANTTTNWITTIPASASAGSVQTLGGFKNGASSADFIVTGTTNVNMTGFGGSRAGGLDVFAAKFSATLNGSFALVLANGNYLGGAGDDLQYNFNSSAVDSSENLYITGLTSPAGFISTSNLTQGSGATAGFGACRSGGTNAFVSKFALGASGPTIDYTTCLSSATTTTASAPYSSSAFGSRNLRELGTALVQFSMAGTGSPGCRCPRTHAAVVGITQSWIGTVVSGNNHNGGFPYLSQAELQGEDGDSFSTGAPIDAFVSDIMQLGSPLSGCSSCT